MKLGPVTKIDKRNKATSKNVDNNLMSANCEIIVIFFISGQFEAIRKPDSGRINCRTYIFVNRNLLFYKK